MSIATFEAKLNPYTGKLQLTRGDSAFHLKDSVTTYNNLPITGNQENDCRVTNDTDLMYTWSVSASSGDLSDWKEIGSAASIDWSAITNGPSSDPADIDDAVSKKHTQNTDTTLILTTEPSSDHTATGLKGTFTAGEGLVFGDVCHIRDTGKFWKADASTIGLSYAIAIALASITTDNPGSFLLIGAIRDDSWAWVVSSPVYLSTTSGELTQTPPSATGEIVQILGIATHADRIYFNPSLSQAEIL